MSKPRTNLTLAEGIKTKARELMAALDYDNNMTALCEQLIREKHAAVFGPATVRQVQTLHDSPNSPKVHMAGAKIVSYVADKTRSRRKPRT